MDIVKQQKGEALELKIQGRIDAYWSDPLTKAIEEAVASGLTRIELNLSRVEYLSSAGIRVLISFHKILKAKDGGLAVTHPSESVMAVLELSGLDKLLVPPDKAGAEPGQKVEHRRWETETAVFHAFDIAPGAKLKCRLVGDPRKLVEGGYEEEDSRILPFPESTFGLGLGAFGSSFAECRDRVGEFLAVAGTAAYLPTDGSNRPDAMVSEDAMVPEVNVLYGLSGHGQFATQIRFEAKHVLPGIVTFPELITHCLNTAGSDLAGVAMLVESSSLVGAALRKSASPTDPGVTLLSFPTDRIFEHALCVIVGVAARQEVAGWETILEPITSNSAMVGHFHVAMFPLQPLPSGVAELHQTMRKLFSNEPTNKLLHVLAHDEGGQTELVKGLCWVGPIEMPAAPAAAAEAAPVGKFKLRIRSS